MKTCRDCNQVEGGYGVAGFRCRVSGQMMTQGFDIPCPVVGQILETFAPDQPVVVWNQEGEPKVERRYSHMKDGRHYCYVTGYQGKTLEGTDASSGWKFCESN